MHRDLWEAAGELRPVFAQVDWSGSPLGEPSTWSPTLRSALDLVLQTRFPATLLWGPEFVCVYNAAYTQLIADKHPQALGVPARIAFAEAWSQVGPLMQQVVETGTAIWLEDELVPLDRHGFVEDCYFTFCYSPVRGPDNSVEGLLDIATETTRQVLDRRRLLLLNQLRSELAESDNAEQVLERALAILDTEGGDILAVDVEPDARPAAVGSIVVDETPEGRYVRLPSPVGETAYALRLTISPRIVLDQPLLDFVRLVGAALNQASTRAQLREAERRAAEIERRMSESLQRSLLTTPVRTTRLRTDEQQVAEVQVAVRYLAASEQAQVGGDWYDSFTLPDGALAIVVGDVAGHDREAAAAMAQVRNLLRGVAYAAQGSPAQLLTGLDHAMDGLKVDSIATAVLARLDPEYGDGFRLRWSNAGHPPPVLVHADGRAELLETDPDLLLGAGDVGERTDHERPLPAGAALVLYSDGLVERRGSTLTAGLDWLVGLLDGTAGLSADELADRVLDALDGPGQDDIALLVVRTEAAPATG